MEGEGGRYAIWILGGDVRFALCSVVNEARSVVVALQLPVVRSAIAVSSAVRSAGGEGLELTLSEHLQHRRLMVPV